MCGIFAYIRSQNACNSRLNPVDVCINGLKLLEYRGYDSSGIAGMIDGKIRVYKRAGKIRTLQDAISKEKLHFDATIAHTRWATHGVSNQENAHPHLDQHQSVAVVHNGIIENHHVLRKKLVEKGVVFDSDTDTEVISGLISYYYSGDLKMAVERTLQECEGSFAIALIHKDHPDQIIGAARESPLVVGIDKKNKEGYLSSDPHSFNGKILDILYLKDGEIIILKNDSFATYNSYGKKVKKIAKTIAFQDQVISKNGFDHYMLKEIFEQPKTVEQGIIDRLKEEDGTAIFEELSLSPQYLQSIRRILILACGTSWHAGLIATSMLKDFARIPTEVEIASEFRYTNPIIFKHTLVVAISQSGETADTIAAVRKAKEKKAKVIALCNVDYSTIVREADASLFLKAGPEMSVCSTKGFTSQLIVIALFTLYIARLRYLSKEQGMQFLTELKELPTKISQVLAQKSQIESFAEKYAQFEHFFFIGRGYMYPTSLEAALKLKEISYLNASGYPGGEMKHGPIALVDPNLAVIGFCGNLQTFDKMISNLMEIKSRGGKILAFTTKGKEEIFTVTQDVLFIPETSDKLATVLYSVAGQLFAYYVAKFHNTDIDQPRNLAKSVTVE